MDPKNIIMKGERAKFFVRSDKWNFNFEDNDYYLEIIYGMQGEKLTIQKKDFMLLNDHWLFSFPTQNMIGAVKARLVMQIVDVDCPQDVREEVDEQYIAFVVNTPCPQFLKCKACGEKHDIVYERTEESDIGSAYARLTDKSGHPFVTSDDMNLMVKRDFIKD